MIQIPQCNIKGKKVPRPYEMYPKTISCRKRGIMTRIHILINFYFEFCGTSHIDLVIFLSNNLDPNHAISLLICGTVIRQFNLSFESNEGPIFGILVICTNLCYLVTYIYLVIWINQESLITWEIFESLVGSQFIFGILFWRRRIKFYYDKEF